MLTEATLMLAAKPVIEGLIKNVINPKLKKFAKKVGLEYNKIMIPKGEHFSEYLHRAYEQYSIAKTLALKHETRFLKDIYQPLTLRKNNSIEEREESSYIINDYPKELISKFSNILIIDTAGMGKSTLSKKMFLSVVDNGLGIPILIELRRLSKNRTIIDDIQDQIDDINCNFDKTLLLEFIKDGEFVFFLDGYDEIPPENKAFVSSHINSFISKAGNNLFFLTSRPEVSLSSFGNFQSFSIDPLKREEAYELLRRYDNQGQVSKLLIEKLMSGKYSMIDDFLGNPLLVSLLFNAFEYKQTIPLKKHIFYRHVYDAYFDAHDLTKGGSYTHDKKTGLDIDDFNKVLRRIGFECIKRQKIEFTKDELLDVIEIAKASCINLSFTCSDFLDDITRSVPLFCQDGVYYKWVHKSLQEYFAARFIYKDSKDDQDKILTSIFQSDNIEKYINMLDIYYDIDDFGFRKNIILPLYKEFVEHYNNSYFNSEIISEESIKRRISFLFHSKILITPNYSAPLGYDSIVDIARKYIGNMTSGAGYDKLRVLVNNMPKLRIFEIIERKGNASIINRKQHNIIHHKIKYGREKHYIIDIRSFSNSQKEYDVINIHMNILISAQGNLDIDLCKKAIKEIEAQIKISKNPIDLSSGF